MSRPNFVEGIYDMTEIPATGILTRADSDTQFIETRFARRLAGALSWHLIPLGAVPFPVKCRTFSE